MATYREVKGYSIKKVDSDPANTKKGQIWYNNSTKVIKVTPLIEAWASGGNLNLARNNLSGCGTQTAALVFGGYVAPAVKNESEEYNGSSWSEGNNLNLARRGSSGAGTQTAGLCMLGYVPPANKSETEEYNGTSWSEQNDASTARRNTAGAGTQTAAFAAG